MYTEGSDRYLKFKCTDVDKEWSKSEFQWGREREREQEREFVSDFALIIANSIPGHFLISIIK